MDHFQLPNESFQYGFEANEQARKAAVVANHGYRYKQAYYEDERIIRKWKELMINAPILLHNILFLLFAVADMIISWEMVRDVVLGSGMAPRFTFLAVLVFCMLINAWAAVTAHFIGKGWSKEIQDWERWNFIFIKNRNQAPGNIVSTEMSQEIRRARFWAIFSGLILLGLVGVIIYYRNFLFDAPLDAGDETLDFAAADEVPNEPNFGFKVVITYLPLAIILGELLTGDYFWYSIRQVQKRFTWRRNKRKFLKHKEQCGQHDQFAVQYTRAAKEAGQFVELMGDLEKSHLRVKFRSQENDNYIDPLDHFKRIGFTVKSRETGKPVTDAAVFGILPNGAKTGDYRTDEHGKVTLHPDGDFDRLVSVFIDRREFLGPFQFNGEHYLDLPESIVEQVHQNGNGHN